MRLEGHLLIKSVESGTTKSSTTVWNILRNVAQRYFTQRVSCTGGSERCLLVSFAPRVGLRGVSLVSFASLGRRKRPVLALFASLGRRKRPVLACYASLGG